MRRQLCDEHVAVENQAAHLEDAMLRRLSKRRLTRLQADIRLIEGRLAEMVATNAAFARLYDLLTSMPGVGAVLAFTLHVVVSDARHRNQLRGSAFHRWPGKPEVRRGREVAPTKEKRRGRVPAGDVFAHD